MQSPCSKSITHELHQSNLFIWEYVSWGCKYLAQGYKETYSQLFCTVSLSLHLIKSIAPRVASIQFAHEMCELEVYLAQGHIQVGIHLTGSTWHLLMDSVVRNCCNPIHLQYDAMPIAPSVNYLTYENISSVCGGGTSVLPKDTFT
jgi:hypothetical protein